MGSSLRTLPAYGDDELGLPVSKARGADKAEPLPPSCLGRMVCVVVLPAHELPIGYTIYDPTREVEHGNGVFPRR